VEHHTEKVVTDSDVINGEARDSLELASDEAHSDAEISWNEPNETDAV
jgi:hypothetical protein